MLIEHCPGCGERYQDCVRRGGVKPYLPFCDLCSGELHALARSHTVSDNDVIALLARHLAFLARRVAKGHPPLPFWCQSKDGSGRCWRRASAKRGNFWVCKYHTDPIFRFPPVRPLKRPSSWRQRKIYERLCQNPACGKVYGTFDRQSKFCSHSCSAIVSNTGRVRSEESCRKTSRSVRARLYGELK